MPTSNDWYARAQGGATMDKQTVMFSRFVFASTHNSITYLITVTNKSGVVSSRHTLTHSQPSDV